MELSLPLVVDDDEVDVFAELVARELFKGRGKDYPAKRRTINESAFFDLFDPSSHMKFFEFGAVSEGPFADEFNRTGNRDALKRFAPTKSAFFDSFNPRSQLKFFEHFAEAEGPLADDFD